jgi:transposase-like protein
MKVKKRIPPSQGIRKEINEIMEGTIKDKKSEQNPVKLLMQKGKLLIAQEALEKEVEEFLERPYYQRDKDGKSPKGYRNGYEPKKIKSPEEPLILYLPQVRDTKEPFNSKMKEFLKNNTEVLDKLAIEMYVRGLSTRDIEDTFIYVTGDKILSRSSVSKITNILWQDYERFINRDLSKYEVLYIVVDAVYEAIRPYVQNNEAIMVAYGILIDGRKVLLHMELGNKESYVFCKGFFRNMTKRNLNTPLAITSDGAPGLIKAIEEIFPKSLRIRCWVHKMRNLANKVPKEIWYKIKPEIEAIRDSLSLEEGETRLKGFGRKYQNSYPSLIRCLFDDWRALLNVLKLPYRHRRTVRSTNLIERTFEEERRRTKIIPQFLTEKSCLKLVFSVLYRAALRWQRIPMEEFEGKEINRLRKNLGIKIPSLIEEKQEVLFRSR